MSDHKKTPYISELKIQLDLINKRLAELEEQAYEGAFSPRFLPKHQVEAKRLIERRKQIQDRIIFTDP